MRLYVGPVITEVHAQNEAKLEMGERSFPPGASGAIGGEGAGVYKPQGFTKNDRNNAEIQMSNMLSEKQKETQ